MLFRSDGNRKLQLDLATKVGFPLPGEEEKATAAILEVTQPGDTPESLRRADLPVHKVCWWGARMYCAWRGHELPTVEALDSAWGKSAYPWGNLWDPMETNTNERYSPGQSVSLHKATGILNFHALHGNVAEFCSDTSNDGEVVTYGGSAWAQGEKIVRGKNTKVDNQRDARKQFVAGNGFRTMLRVPETWNE